MWFVLTLLSALLWSASSLVDKLAVNWGFRTLEVLPATYAAGFLVVAFGHPRLDELLQWPVIVSGAVLAIFSLLNAFALLMALRCGKVGLVSAVAGSHCVITAISATILIGEQLGRRQWLAIAMTVAGLVLVYGISGSLVRHRHVPRRQYRWFWLAILAAVGSSGETIGIKLATRLSEGAHLSLWWEYGLATIVCFVLVGHFRVRLRWDSSWFGMMDGALTGLGMLTFGIALALGPASLVATVATAAVLFRALGGIIFFGDQAAARQWLGFCLLFMSFILVKL